jgi:hypothetical protein
MVFTFFLFSSDVRTRFDDNDKISVQSHYLSFFEFGLVVISFEFTSFIPNMSAFIRHFYTRLQMKIKTTSMTFSDENLKTVKISIIFCIQLKLVCFIKTSDNFLKSLRKKL